MAHDIGAKIAIEGEKEFKNAIKSIDMGLKTLNTELKATASAYDRNDKSVKNLSAQNQVLAKTIDVQKNKVAELQKMVDKSAKAYGEADDKTQKYQQELNKAVAALNKAEMQHKNNEKAIKNHTSETIKATMQTGEMRKAQDRLRNTFNAVKVAVVAVVGSMAAMAVKAGQSADDINTLAAQTGLTTNEIQRFKYATELIDVPLETLTKSMARLVRNMEAARQGSKNQIEAFKAMGVAILNNDGTLRNHHDVFGDIINALGRMENETQRDAIAMQLFGRSAQELNPLILGGAETLKKLGDEAEAAGLILSQDTLDSANELNDAIDILKATASGTFAKIGSEIATGLTPYIQDLGEKLKNADFSWLVTGFKFIMDNGKIIISTIAAIGAGMAVWNVAQTIYAVVQAIQVWRGAMEAAQIAQTGLNIAMASNPIGLVVTALAALTAGLFAYKMMAGQAKSASQELYDETKKLGEEYHNSTAEIKKSEAADLAKMGVAKDLKNELFDLNEQVKAGTLTEGEATEAKKRMHTIADQLRQLMPDLVLAFDKETGALITQGREIDDLILKYENLAKVKAAQALLEKAYATQIEAQIKKDQAVKGQAGALYNLDYLGNPYEKSITQGYSNKEIQYERALWATETDRLKGYEKTGSEADKVLAETGETITTIREKLRSLGAEAAATTGKVEGLGETFTGAGAAATGGAKSAGNAEKDLTRELEQQRDKRFKDLKFNLDMGYITEEQYYNGLETLRDEYFAEGSEEWQKYTLDIYNYQKKTFEEAQKDIKATFTEIAKTAISEIEEVKRAQEGLENKLKGYATLFQKVRIKEGDKVTEFTALGNLDKANEELTEYSNLLKAVKERGADVEIFKLLRDMPISEAISNASTLLGASDENFQRFNESFRKSRELSAGIAGEAYADDMTSVVQRAANSMIAGLEGLTDEYSGLGQGYAEAIGAGFTSAIKGVFTSIKSEVQSQMSNLGLSMGGYTVGAVTNSTYAPVINMYGKPATPAEATRAAQKQYTIDRARGLLG